MSDKDVSSESIDMFKSGLGKDWEVLNQDDDFL